MSVLISASGLLERRAVVTRDPVLQALQARLDADLARVLAQPLYVPEAKALLSRWGQHCRDDGAELGFDPFQPHGQRCTACGRAWDTEQAHRWWVYWYQLWLAERVWMMALRSGEGGDPAAEARAIETLAALAARYASWPNADNVLGPSRPFFSTYLESVWVLQLAAATGLLEDLGRLPPDLGRDLREHLFRPSAALIADFDEGRSNRQAWNATALFALGRVLDDRAMQERAADGPSGILALARGGLGRDGLWYEGENYHWFALRGLSWGAELLRTAGWRVDDAAASALRAAYLAPALTVQPDFTFPARRDAKFGVSLRQRRMAELWELARARLGDGTGLDGLLRQVYDPACEPADEPWREITEVERAEPAGGVRRDRLGWKALLWMRPDAPAAGATWTPATAHLAASGIAVIRRDAGATYVGLDYGDPGGGHGHADRLHLTLWDRGVPWLVDFGTGAYTAPTLAWYRSTLAHNAPLVDGHGQHPAAGQCVAFDEQGAWAWVCALLPDGSAFDGAAVQRTVVVGPGYLLDVLQLHGDGERVLALPWHGLGQMLADEAGLTVVGPEGTLRILLTGRQPFRVAIQQAPGPPSGTGGVAEDLDYAVAVASGESITLVAAVDLGAGLAEVECVEEDFLVRHADGRVDLHRASDDGWEVELERGDPVRLGGLVEPPEEEPPAPPRFEAPAARIPRVSTPPALDGTTAGFPAEPTLRLDREDQFRRAEDPWPGADTFSARAHLAHDGAVLYVAVDVTAPDPWFRPAAHPDPEWENENPDIHSDGIQLFVESNGTYGWLLVPVPDAPGVRVSGVRGTDGVPEMIVDARWEPTPTGYGVTFAVDVPGMVQPDLYLDLCVNRRGSGRERRGGQLVWSGARGARLYLAGDRPVPGPLPRVTTA